MFSVIGTTQAMQASQSFTHPSVPRYSTTISLVKAVEFNVIPGRACKTSKKMKENRSKVLKLQTKALQPKRLALKPQNFPPNFFFFL
jgi:hypothetical protein